MAKRYIIIEEKKAQPTLELSRLPRALAVIMRYHAHRKANLDKYYETNPKIEKPPKTGLPWWMRLVLILLSISVLGACSCASVYLVMGYFLLR